MRRNKIVSHSVQTSGCLILASVDGKQGLPNRQRSRSGTTLHALLCLLFPDRIALRFGFPDAPRSLGFCRQCICWRISRSLWNGTGGFGRGSDLLIFGGTGLVCGFLLSATFCVRDGGCFS